MRIIQNKSANEPKPQTAENKFIIVSNVVILTKAEHDGIDYKTV